jgi:hypothetical protein
VKAMTDERIEDSDQGRYHMQLADKLGITPDELEEWMTSEEELLDGAGRIIGHVVHFKKSLPLDLRARVRGMSGEYTAHAGVVTLDQQ